MMRTGFVTEMVVTLAAGVLMLQVCNIIYLLLHGRPVARIPRLSLMQGERFFHQILKVFPSYIFFFPDFDMPKLFSMSFEESFGVF